MPICIEHRNASQFVASLKAPWLTSLPDGVLDAPRLFSKTLEFDASQEHVHRISVAFSYSKEKGSEFIFVRSTNWRYEDEPGGWLRREDAAELYHLIRAQPGFTILRKFVDGQEVETVHYA